jgi:hypothetical protein
LILLDDTAGPTTSTTLAVKKVQQRDRRTKDVDLLSIVAPHDLADDTFTFTPTANVGLLTHHFAFA